MHFAVTAEIKTYDEMSKMDVTLASQNLKPNQVCRSIPTRSTQKGWFYSQLSECS